MVALAPSPLSPFRAYWSASRAARYSLLFALPLFIFYQVLVALQPVGPRGGEWRNGADVLLQQLFISVVGRRGPLIFLLLLTIVGLWLVVKDKRANRSPLAPWVFWVMLAESAVLAILCGMIVGALTAQVVGASTALALATPDGLSIPTRLMLSLGAGLYEELLFRVVLVGSLALGARALFGWRPWAAGAFAVGLGAVIFSAFHYVGPYGDRLEFASFVFRTIAGLFFSALFVARGFGITAWTHALYDVFVLVL